MQSRIFDLLLGLALGNYFATTFTIMSFPIHWSVIALAVFIIAQFVKWAGKTLWTKFIQALANEINKLNGN